mmetsp:Transcript_4537/g.17849  ORF Transcript_4537/g.17849 Transcript_4537/m.17849 type:complete len:308 (+) Transcript_4537:328-1251(+)
MREQLLRPVRPQRNVWQVKVLHIVAAFHVLMHVAAPRAPKGLDGKHLSFLHASRVAALHNRDAFACMDLIRGDRVSVEVADRFHGVGHPIDLTLVGLHDLLNVLADLVQGHVDAGRADALVGGLLNGFHQRLILVIEVDRPRAVDDAPLNLRAKIHLHDVVVREHGVVPWVGRVVRRDVVQAAARRKGNAPLQARFHHELSVLLLQPLAHVNELDARLDEALRVPAHLAVALRGVAHLVIHLEAQVILRSLLLRVHAERVEVVRMRQDLALGEVPRLEKLRDRDGRWIGLSVANVIVHEAADAEERR